VERAIMQAAAVAKYPVRYWDCANGITDESGRTIENFKDPSQAIAFIKDRKDRCVYVMRDLHKWTDPVVLRGIRSLARMLQSAKPDEARTIVILTPSNEIPPEWAGHATAIDYPLPDRPEIAALLDDVLAALPEDVRTGAAPNGTRDAAIDAAVGLSAEEAANCYARSLVTTRKIDPALVSSEKKRVIARERVLTWYDPDPRGLDAIGGLELLKGWLTARKAAFSPAARAFGLPAPRGAFLVGVPGCGKSLTAKAIAAAWAMPLLRLDMGALRSKYVGESEQNIRKALQVAETVSPCVLWLDEIEKSLAGASGPAGDGGVAADALGAVLSWMQERTGSVFVIATANDVRALPPELLRKGRFDELFFVDLPTTEERAAIVDATLRQFNRAGALVNEDTIARATAGFTGAELAALVPDALFTAFADGARDLTTADLLAAAANVVPLSKTAADKIDAVRAWAKGRARPASAPEATTATTGRALDL
jgi:SpoVK/Ycf46/Vps4 family AAA+-type ATPase